MITLTLNSVLKILIAYLDPGSGSLLIQLIIAALVGAGIFIRSRWEKVKNIFRKSSSEIEEKGDFEEDDFDV